MSNKIELLAPAGNFECLAAAVQNGADAVYIAGKCFGARSFAENFDNDELIRAVDYCHLRGVKAHITVNTLVSDSEFPAAAEYLAFLNNIGADAVIVQDMGVADFILKNFTELEVHASTQMTVHNSDGVLALEDIGVKRVVLSRELSTAELSEISAKTSAELEVFGHGALCMCYSGQCLMSSIIGGRSGNRGKCAQPCRLPYTVRGNGKKAFYLSLKDLCSLEHIAELEKIGISSLKIEGRMKGAAYVAAAVRVYRKYIDCPAKINQEDIALLDSIFNRGGLTDGYLIGKTGTHMFAFDKPDNPYRREDAELAKAMALSAKEENRKTVLDCRIDIKEGKKVTLTISANGIDVTYTHEKAAETAQKQPLTSEGVAERLRKTGGTPFEFGKIDVKIEENPYLAASELNAVRRNSLELFAKAYAESFRRKSDYTLDIIETDEVPHEKPRFTCEVTTIEQYRAVKSEKFELWYVPLHIVQNNRDELEEIKEKTVIVLPAIIHENENERIKAETKRLIHEGFRGVLISNIAQLCSFRGEKIYGGFRLNIFNSRALGFYAEHGVFAAELSPELTMRQISDIKKSVPVQVQAYGRLPLMITENCVIKNGGGCPCNSGSSITDRMGMTFPIIKDGSSCRNVILNCKKTFTADNLDAFGRAGVSLLRIYFTDEGADECRRICGAFMHGLQYRPEDFTGAHYYKGVM